MLALGGDAVPTTVEATPFARHGVTLIKLSRETPRNRRLNADLDEEGKLLAWVLPPTKTASCCATAQNAGNCS